MALNFGTTLKTVASRVVVLKFQEELEKRRQQAAAMPPARVLGREMPVERLPSWTQGGGGVSLPNPLDLLRNRSIQAGLRQAAGNIPMPGGVPARSVAPLVQSALPAANAVLGPYQHHINEPLAGALWTGIRTAASSGMGGPVGVPGGGMGTGQPVEQPTSWSGMRQQYEQAPSVLKLSLLLASDPAMYSPLIAKVGLRGVRAARTMTPAIEAKVAELYPVGREAVVGGEAGFAKIPGGKQRPTASDLFTGPPETAKFANEITWVEGRNRRLPGGKIELDERFLETHPGAEQGNYMHEVGHSAYDYTLIEKAKAQGLDKFALQQRWREVAWTDPVSPDYPEEAFAGAFQHWFERPEDAIRAGRRYGPAEMMSPEERTFFEDVFGPSGPRVREAVVGGEAGKWGPFGKKAAEPVLETAIEPTAEEQLRAMTNAPKGERPERTIRRLYEGGVASEMEQRDTEVADAAKLLRGADIPNVRGLRRTENATAIMDAIDYQGPIDEAITRSGLTPGQAELARTLRLGMEGETQRMLAADPNFNPREFYWPHEWRAKRMIQGVGGGQRTIGGKPFFTKARQLEGTVTEVIAQREADIAAAQTLGKKAPRSLDLVTWNPVEGMQRRLYKGIIYRRQLNIVQQLKQSGLAKPASEFEGEVVGWRVPKGIRPFESKPVPGDPKTYTQPWLVPNDIATALEDHFKASIFDQKVPLKVLKEAAADLKYLKVFGGLFQDFDYSMRAIAEATKGRDIRMLGTPFRALGRAYIPGLNARMTRLEAVGTAASDVRRRMLLEQGLNAQAGLGFMGSEYQRAAGELKLFKIPVVGRALKAFGSGSFQNAHREFLLDIGEKRMTALVEGGMDATEAAARTALDMNETFSSLPAWQSVFRDPSTRDALRVTFFSTPEQESWVRMPFRQKGFFLAILGDVIVMENMASLAFNHTLLPPDRYIPFNADGSFNTHFLRATTGKGADGRELFLDLLGQADTTLRLASSMTPMVAGAAHGKFKGPSPSVLESRLHVLPSTAAQLYKGRSWFGQEPTRGNIGQTAKFLAEQVSPIPLTSFTSERARIGGPAAAVQLTGVNISAESLPDLRNRTAKADPDFNDPTTGQPRKYDELDRQAKLDYKAKYPGHFATSEELPEGTPMQRMVELSEEKTRRLKEIGDQYALDHNGAAYVAARSDILTDIATRQDEVSTTTDYKPKTDEQKAVQEWNQYIATAKAAAPGNTLSGAAFGSLEDKARSEMGDIKWALVEQSRMASADPVEKQYLQDRAKMEAYFGLEDQLWAKLVTNNPKCPEKLKQYATYRDYIEARALELMGQGYARENVYLDPVSKDFEKAMTPYSQGFLGKNPDVDALRAIWGYSLGVHTGKAASFYFERTGLKARQISG